ncbi:MAG: hypothetical protein EZS28_009889 [Streblomastix strix]|uniref:Uncharacterized protein n=1 Tax=Streblomastix strix TaxID=222440 RepID=A0A5J4WJU2_9EUKA|nr:MAG: hypothetical protein EZS28_009889 [Streblomastix strix]
MSQEQLIIHTGRLLLTVSIVIQIVFAKVLGAIEIPKGFPTCVQCILLCVMARHVQSSFFHIYSTMFRSFIVKC